jgi:Probable lipoprotein LpqN
MIQIVGTRRVFAGGLVAGAIGVAVFAAGSAAADPARPVPAPVPAPASPLQAAAAAPGGVTNRFVAAPAPQAPPVAPAPAPAAVAAPAAAAAAAPPVPSTQTPAVTGTLREYLQSKGVTLEAQKAAGFKALDITLPMPPRWTQVPDPNVPDAFAVIADRLGSSIYTSNAQVVVYKLTGTFDPKEAITHSFVDSQRLLAWQTTNASLADFGGLPSSVIEGTFRQDDMTLNTSRRTVIASSGADKYLVSLAVTTAATQAVADAPATDAIVNGFRVAAPGSPAQAPAPAPAPPAAPAPAPPTQALRSTAVGVVGQPMPSQVPLPAALPAQQGNAAQPAAVPQGLPAQAPSASPGLPAQAPSASPGLPARNPSASQGLPNLLTLVPGLPPLPNLNLGLTR